MELERRGRVKRSHDRGNWKQEDFDACDRHALRLACLREAGGAIPPAYSPVFICGSVKSSRA